MEAIIFSASVFELEPGFGGCRNTSVLVIIGTVWVSLWLLGIGHMQSYSPVSVHSGTGFMCGSGIGTT